MLSAIKKLFTRTVQLTSEIFQKAEIIEEDSQEIEPPKIAEKRHIEPKIKTIKRQNFRSHLSK